MLRPSKFFDVCRAGIMGPTLFRSNETEAAIGKPNALDSVFRQIAFACPHVG